MPFLHMCSVMEQITKTVTCCCCARPTLASICRVATTMGDMGTDQVTMAQAMLGLVWALGGHTMAAGVEQMAAK